MVKYANLRTFAYVAMTKEFVQSFSMNLLFFWNPLTRFGKKKVGAQIHGKYNEQRVPLYIQELCKYIFSMPSVHTDLFTRPLYLPYRVTFTSPFFCPS